MTEDALTTLVYPQVYRNPPAKRIDPSLLGLVHRRSYALWLLRSVNRSFLHSLNRSILRRLRRSLHFRSRRRYSRSFGRGVALALASMGAVLCDFDLFLVLGFHYTTYVNVFSF